MKERRTIRCIRAARADGRLPEIFGAADLRRLGKPPTTAGNFLSKHRLGNPSHLNAYFVRVSEKPALYSLLEEASGTCV
jgi:hypothetical protein